VRRIRDPETEFLLILATKLGLRKERNRGKETFLKYFYTEEGIDIKRGGCRRGIVERGNLGVLDLAVWNKNTCLTRKKTEWDDLRYPRPFNLKPAKMKEKKRSQNFRAREFLVPRAG